jgi:hypothetical protein
VAFKTSFKKHNPTTLENGVPLIWGAPNEPTATGSGNNNFEDYDAGSSTGEFNFEGTGILEGFGNYIIDYTIDSASDATTQLVGCGGDISLGRFVIGACGSSFGSPAGRIRVYKIPTNNRNVSGIDKDIVMENEIISTDVDDGFGIDVGCQGKKAVVITRGNSSTDGKAYLFNDFTTDAFSDGTLLKTFSDYDDGGITNIRPLAVFRQDRILLTFPSPQGASGFVGLDAELYNSSGTHIKTISDSGYYFGTAADIGCGRIVISSMFTSGSNGQIRIYDLNGNLIKTVFAPSGEGGARYGKAVTVAGGYIFVAAPGAAGLDGTWVSGSGDHGQIHKYDLDGNHIETFNASGRGDEAKGNIGGVPSQPYFGNQGMFASGGRLCVMGGFENDLSYGNASMITLTLDGDHLGYSNRNLTREELLSVRNGWFISGKPSHNSERGRWRAGFIGEHLTPYDVIDYNKGRR